MKRLIEFLKSNPLIQVAILLELGVILLILLNPILASWLNLKPPANICRLWFIGIIIDVISFLLFFINYLKYRTEFGIGIPIIGWALYSLSCILCPQPILFNTAIGESSLAITVLLKVMEFILFTCVHCLFQFGLPRIVWMGLKKE